MTSPRISLGSLSNTLYSFCDVNVVSMRIEQEVAYVFPGALASRPRSEQLNWITVRLRPAAAGLQSFVQLPPQISLPLMIQNRAPFICIGDRRTVSPRDVPTPLPLIEPEPTYRINVGSSSHLVMTKNPRLKENADPDAAAVSHLQSKAFKYLF